MTSSGKWSSQRSPNAVDCVCRQQRPEQSHFRSIGLGSPIAIETTHVDRIAFIVVTSRSLTSRERQPSNHDRLAQKAHILYSRIWGASGSRRKGQLSRSGSVSSNRGWHYECDTAPTKSRIKTLPIALLVVMVTDLFRVCWHCCWYQNWH